MYVAPRGHCSSQFRLLITFPDGVAYKTTRYFSEGNNKHWHKLTYRHNAYVDFPSHVIIKMEGKADEDRVGFYGCKFALARLQLVRLEKEVKINESSSIDIEPKQELVEDIPNSNEELKYTKHLSFMKRLKNKLRS